ncbi:hypothetical protein [Algicella marina]|uniref:Uncharacterized protein n=1 Tax=Algicella marina TaxID=2683284 RepID=A0A6P1SZQ2_9RHOB|nr:hypothetical protein [Algicella marina]QHQ36154.1 hypothetical protein GO499_13740 [Algicella marina]
MKYATIALLAVSISAAAPAIANDARYGLTDEVIAQLSPAELAQIRVIRDGNDGEGRIKRRIAILIERALKDDKHH